MHNSFIGRVHLQRGPSVKRPITLVIEGPRGEDGESSRAELDLDALEAEDLARSLRTVAQWVAEGIWRGKGDYEGPEPPCELREAL